MNFLEIIFILLLSKNFDMAKNVRGFLKNLFEYFLKFFMYLFIYLFIYLFLNIIVSANFFSDLKFEYCCDYYPEILLQESLKQET